MMTDFYREVIEKTNVGYACHQIICNEQGMPVDYEYLDINKKFEEFTGLKKEDLIGKTFYQAIPNARESVTDWVAIYGDIALNQTIKEFEMYSEHFNKWYRIYAFSPEKGKFVTTFIDITPDIQRNQEYETFFSLNLDLFSILDLEGRFIKHNKAWETLLGYTHLELSKAVAVDFIHPDDLEKTIEAHKNLIETNTLAEFENRYRKKDGTYVHLQWNAVVKDQKFFAATRDVSSFYREKSMLETVLDNIEARIYIADLETYEILFINEFGKRHYGDVLGQKCWAVFHQNQTGPCDFCKIPHIYGEKSYTDGKFRWEYQSEISGKWLDVHERIITWIDGRLAHMQLAIDIDDKKKMEIDLLQAKEEAELASMAKTHFLANTSHEIRTPMNGILGFLNLLEDAGMSPEKKLYIENIKKSSDLLLRVVNDILDISKIESGKLEMEIISFNLRNTIEDSVDLFNVKAMEKGLDMHLLVNSNVPEVIKSDPTRYKQVLNNLLSNAVKFTEKGNIFIDVTAEYTSENFADIIVSIKDTGIGMDQKTMDSIFMPFNQADTSSTRKYEGTGLGLSITKKIIDALGGSVTVTSQLGSGSTFVLRIPADIDTEHQDEFIMNYEVLKGKRFLLVDDNQMNLDIARMFLEEEGAYVTTAESAPKALTILLENINKNMYDAILADYQMPVMDGFDLIKAVRAIPALEDIPAFLITSMAGLKQADKARELSYSGYLTKPYKRREFLDCITLLFDNPGTYKPESNYFITRHKVKEINGSKKKKILVVEDNEVNLALFTKILSTYGYSCDVAVNGLEALNAYKNKTYDVIFMDCQMPVMDGFQATREIRTIEQEKNRKTAIVAVTAYAMKEDHQNCIEAGMDDYLSKPIVTEELERVINRYLR